MSKGVSPDHPIHEVISKRGSPDSYSSRPVPEADLLSIFEAARWAASGTGRLEIHYTPKHGSWLNAAEIVLSALCRHCLNRRIPDLRRMQHEIAAWEADRNNQQPKIN